MKDTLIIIVGEFSATSLLFPPILFEVPSLKLLAAHSLDSATTTENRTDEAIHSQYGTNSTVMATMTKAGETVQCKLSATSSHEKLGNMLANLVILINPQPSALT